MHIQVHRSAERTGTKSDKSSPSTLLSQIGLAGDVFQDEVVVHLHDSAARQRPRSNGESNDFPDIARAAASGSVYLATCGTRARTSSSSVPASMMNGKKCCSKVTAKHRENGRYDGGEWRGAGQEFADTCTQ